MHYLAKHRQTVALQHLRATQANVETAATLRERAIDDALAAGVKPVQIARALKRSDRHALHRRPVNTIHGRTKTQ